MRNHINISEIPGTNPLIKDYLKKEKSLFRYYSRSFSCPNLLEQAREKLSQYPYRKELVKEINKQLSNLDLTEKQKDNLHKLSLENTVTITTGHQLNLMTGPLYFIYKILHVIKLCDSMNRQQKEINFIPIFWMATEDHDFKEINHFYFKNRKIEWDKEYHDFVGEIPTLELKNVLNDFYEELKYFPKGKELRKIIEDSYFSKNNLSEATQIIVHNLFKEYGLLFIDGNSKSLKQIFIPYVEKDIENQESYKFISQTIKELKVNYKIQVNPREINFFYHENKERTRIEKREERYYILGTDKSFSQEEILKELRNYPEKFSPNALMRPVYQEVILPNTAYIGGNAEISYWLELKKYFDGQKLPFPVLIPRNSFVLFTENQIKRMEKFQWKKEDLFIAKDELISSLLTNNSETKFDFSHYEQQLKQVFRQLLEESQHTDPSWKDMILAQQQKQLNGLKKINKRFYKAQKIKYAETVFNFEKLHSELFPKASWQERIENFSYFYLIMGKDFFDLLYNEICEYDSVVNLSCI